MTAKSRSRQELKGKIKSPPAKPTKTKATVVNPRLDTLRKMLLDRRREVLKEIEELIGHRLCIVAATAGRQENIAMAIAARAMNV